jgi:hypothetical protein
MRHPAVRWSVLAIAVVAAAGCCYWAATLEQRALDKRRTLSAATSDARSLQKALADTRRALSAMASPGQAAVSWSRQATASIDTARAKLAALMTTDGGAALREHAERLDKLADAEARLHDNAVSGRALMASDVAFGEALPHVDALDHQVAETIGAMIETGDRDLAATRDQQILALAGALGVLGVAAVLLTPTPRRRDLDEPAAVADGAEPAADGLSLAVPPAPVAPPMAAVAPVAVPAPLALPRVELTPLAAACDALARLADGDKLPGVLDTVAGAGARGIAVAGQRRRNDAAGGGVVEYDRRIERFSVIAVTTTTHGAGVRARATGDACRGGRTTGCSGGADCARGTTGVLSSNARHA